MTPTRLAAALALALLIALTPGPAAAGHNNADLTVPRFLSENEDAPKWDLALWLTWVHVDVRDTHLTVMVDSYGTGCYNDIDITLANTWKQAICYLKAKNTFGDTANFEPFSTPNRAQAANRFAKTANYLETLPSSGSGWIEGVNGCDYFADVDCNDTYAHEIGQMYVNGVTAGCDSAPRRFCPAANVEHGTLYGWTIRTQNALD